MVQRGKDLSFGAETAQRFRVVHRRVDQLDGHLLSEFAVDALAAVDGAHAAPTDLLDEPEAADTLQVWSLFRAPLVLGVLLDLKEGTRAIA